MADSIRIGHGNIQSQTPAEFVNGNCVARDVPATLHVDLSTAMVHVANLLRLRGRYGDFYIFDKHISFIDEFKKNSARVNRNVYFEFNILADTASRGDLLLHDVALSIAGVAYGNISNELARGD